MGERQVVVSETTDRWRLQLANLQSVLVSCFHLVTAMCQLRTPLLLSSGLQALGGTNELPPCAVLQATESFSVAFRQAEKVFLSCLKSTEKLSLTCPPGGPHREVAHQAGRTGSCRKS